MFRSGTDLTAEDITTYVDDVLRDEKVPDRVRPAFKAEILETIRLARDRRPLAGG